MAVLRQRAYKPAVRVLSALFAIGFMLIYSVSKSPPPDSAEDLSTLSKAVQHVPKGIASSQKLSSGALVGPEGFSSRHLLSSDALAEENAALGDSDNDSDNDTDCSAPRGNHTASGYNNSCEYVLDQCGDQAQLFNYLRLVLCDLRHVEWLGYFFLVNWLLYLISLLATTADNFFVPPLNLLSEKLQLSPSIAGITLLAIGNGAPDVFTAYAGLKQDDIQLVLGALIGASIFISTVVLGTIILVVRIRPDDIDKIDFVRDVTAYLLVVALVVGVAYDGEVRLFEAVGFLLFYILYITVAVIISYLRDKEKRKKLLVFDYLMKKCHPYCPTKCQSKSDEEDASETEPIFRPKSIQASEVNIKSEVVAALKNGEQEKEEEEEKGPHLELLGLTWPRGAHIASKVQFVVEWPMSVLRWISVPPCYYDGQWTKWHYGFAVISPIPMIVLLIVAFVGWSGFYNVWVGKMPILAFLACFGIPMTIAFALLLHPRKPPHWTMQIILGILAFVMSIAWLNIEANEVVAVLDAFGLLFSIDTGILGLTVLAIGNSVGDWVADTAVARAGKPGMGIASCFGSPLLNDVLGLSIALMTRIAIYDHGKPYTFNIHAQEFLKVKMSWIFLGISLISSVIVIPLFRFSPPKPFGVALIYLYLVFMVFSVLNETGHFDIDFLR